MLRMKRIMSFLEVRGGVTKLRKKKKGGGKGFENSILSSVVLSQGKRVSDLPPGSHGAHPAEEKKS